MDKYGKRVCGKKNEVVKKQDTLLKTQDEEIQKLRKELESKDGIIKSLHVQVDWERRLRVAAEGDREEWKEKFKKSRRVRARGVTPW